MKITDKGRLQISEDYRLVKITDKERLQISEDYRLVKIKDKGRLLFLYIKIMWHQILSSHYYDSLKITTVFKYNVYLQFQFKNYLKAACS